MKLTAERLAKLTILKAIMAEIQIKIKIRRYFPCNKTRRAPNAVDTPLPPLNLSQTGNMCPKVGATATRAICQLEDKKTIAK